MLIILNQDGGNNNSILVRNTCERLGKEFSIINVDSFLGVSTKQWGDIITCDSIANCKLQNVTGIFNGVYTKIGRKLSDDSSRQYEQFIHQELYDLLFGSLSQIDGVLWMNNPQQIIYANNKTLQLTIAKDLGFTIPRTIVSNNKATLVNFFHNMNGQVITKAIHMGNIAHTDNNQHVLLYTSKVTKESLEKLHNNNDIPILFQEYIYEKIELRIVVCRTSVFACSVNDNIENVDWRLSLGAIQNSSVIIPPPELQKKCVALISKLGLTFGVIDILKDRKSDTYYFLEINQQGTWNWMEEKLDLPISETIVKTLEI